MEGKAKKLLKTMLGECAEFKDGQLEAIKSALSKNRALIVQKTGWGKSIVYFIATKIIREQGQGPTILISPLISLMRNQIENAEKLGLKAFTINSANQEEWADIKQKLLSDDCDILLLAPEKLGNTAIIKDIINSIPKGIGMFVVDEAHCISDWGHDFRPDYRRIINFLNNLPPNVPVMATTATANERVIEDIANQLGENITILKGPLTRESLSIQVIKLNDQAERLAWLATNINKFPGSGIIYCLTVQDCEKVAKWLQLNDISVNAYHAKLDSETKKDIEVKFMNNEIKVIVATVALGMGYDKADLNFVIHYQRPGSIVSYYQQIGRAGRKLDNAYAILLNGMEDDEIQEYFINTAFPTQKEMNEVVNYIEQKSSVKKGEILKALNIKPSRLDKCLKFLEVENIISKDGASYSRTLHQWRPDIEKSKKITEQRIAELKEMQEYTDIDTCYMKFISEKLDDPYARDCNKCKNCLNKNIVPIDVKESEIIAAIKFLKGEFLEILPRKQWPEGIKAEGKKAIKPEERNEIGKTLCSYGDAGWGKIVKLDKYENEYFSDELVDASVELIRTWAFSEAPTWITYVPSLNRPELVKSFAYRVAEKLNIPCYDAIDKVQETKQQKTMENSIMQCANAVKGFSVNSNCQNGSVILIDDMVDSKWTLTVCGSLLKDNGANLVYPFTIASTAGGSGDE